MRLTTLEIKGFKSFADRQVIHFNDDVIGVVGPNGCGKSNIVDAIRWVLGEQKTNALRSEKMENVIFNGSKERKQGQLAEVSLTFENTKNILPTEYGTVTIKRMLYRSGESEYRINNVKCRLKDITDLLADTGMGPDSYAIIALNMVDDLLADKENARLKLFEQAAGISKYKIRKRETLSKLKGAEEDLNRVEDLLFEIDGNLKTLEKQAKRAKRYFEIKDEYKSASIQLAMLRLSTYKARYKDLEVKMQAQEDFKLQIDTKIAELEAGIEKEKLANVDKERNLSDRQRQLNSTVGKLRGLENDKKVLSQKTLFVQESGLKLHERIQQAEQRVQQYQLDVERYAAQRDAEEAVLKALEAVLEEAKQQAELIRESHGQLKSELDSFLKQQQAIEASIFDTEKQKAILNSKRDNARREVESLENDLERRSAEISSLTKRLREADSIQETKEKLISSMEQEEEKRLAELEKLNKLVEQYQEELTKINRSLDAKRNEYKLTKSMVDNLEGFPESIRFLSKESGWKAKAPLLSDIIFVIEAYRTPIENYLDQYLNYYVVKDLSEAVQAIQLLDAAQKGKANFFLLDQFTQRKERSTLMLPAEWALDVIEVDHQYQKLVDYLLGNVYVTERPVQEALKDFAAGPYAQEDLIILSKTGGFVKRKLSVSGGSVGLFEGKRIGRQKNLDLLSEEIRKLEDQATKIERQLDDTRMRQNELKNAARTPQIQQEREALNRLVREGISLKGQLDNLESSTLDAETKLKISRETIAASERDEMQLNTRLQQLSHEVSLIRERIAHADGSYRSIADQLSAASTSYNQQHIEFIRQQNKISGTERELSFLKRQLEDTTRQMGLDREALAQSDAELKTVSSDIKTLDSDLLNLYEERKVQEKLLAEAEQLYYQSRTGINKIEDELRVENRKRQDNFQLINNLQQEFSNIKIELTSMNERLQVEFNIKVNDIINQEPEPGLVLEEVEELVDKHRQRLHNYGEINPMAVEAYDEMKERFDFISAQREDLLNAKASLLDTIDEIESKATAKFLDSFAQVRENFQTVFRSLFTEDDSCDLILSEPENPLESHINIIAKPKGKRPQSINQLSGGEKTLTATALLFALYLLKPAPFCIFDEVDAPLDDANIAKFNNIIKRFSERSQFIIVTHNKQTMASVGMIYGVTMKHQGVSQVVPVDFRSLN